MTTMVNAMNDLKVSEPADTALQLADQLVDEAIWAGDAVCVFAGSAAPMALGEPAPHGTVGASAYDGTAGVARFLYRADRHAPERYKPTAHAAMRHAMRTGQGFSLFSGSLGVAVIALEAGEAEFVDPAVRLIDDAIVQAQSLGDQAPADLLAGLAGVIMGLDAALTHAPPWLDTTRWTRAMIDFGTTLHRTGTPGAVGMSWPVYPGSPDHLCGLAHGASGVAYAMQLLANCAPAFGPWVEVATAARDWERLYFSQAQGSWADLRSEDQPSGDMIVAEPVCPHMWCHGSIGIAAERLTAGDNDRLAAMDRIAALEALCYSAESTIDAPRGKQGSHVNNGSQCHGLSGSIDVLLDAALVAGEPAPFVELAHRAAAAMRADAQEVGAWRCGIPSAAETPGLMTGLAGIGWAFLRLADPEDIPSAWRLGSWPGQTV